MSQLPKKTAEPVGPATVETWSTQVHSYFQAIVHKLKLSPDVCRIILIEKFKAKVPDFRQDHIDGIHIVTRGGIVRTEWANRWILEDFPDSTPFMDALQEILESDINQ